MATTSCTQRCQCVFVCTAQVFSLDSQAQERFVCLSRAGAGGSKHSGSTKMGRWLFKRCQSSLGIEEAEQIFCPIQSLVFSCPSTEFFLMDLKHFQNEWAKFPGAVTCQAFSLAAKSLSALQTTLNIGDGSPLLLQTGSQSHVCWEGVVSKRSCFSSVLTPPSCQSRVSSLNTRVGGYWYSQQAQSESHLCLQRHHRLFSLQWLVKFYFKSCHLKYLLEPNNL